MKSIFKEGKIQVLDGNGDPVSGAKLTFYDTGTSNLEDTYSDYARSSANDSPVVCDSEGRAIIFLKKNNVYDYTITDSDDVAIYPKFVGVKSEEPPLTTKGDIFAFDTDYARLAVGSDDQVLTADSGEATGLKWASGTDSTLTTKGDLRTYDTGQARLPVGNDGSLLIADSGETTGLGWKLYAVRATTSGTVSLTADTWITITYDTEAQDSDTQHNTSTYTTTIGETGWYVVMARGTVTSPDSNYTYTRYVYTPSGGSAEYINIGTHSSTSSTYPLGLWAAYLGANDTISVQMHHANTTKVLAAGAILQLRRIG